ncbi:ferritin [Micrococcoides hystricis]|uniref:Ferritin n=1 Tax=Micrococcoides hystricis TaxID=1572761 RepID=A0ABV6PCQ6_9MICC
MQMPEKLQDAFNDQVTLEFQANMVYRQLAIDMDDRDLTGFAKWFRAQADEEIVHANKFIDHMLDRDIRPKLLTVELDATSEGLTPLEAFKAALDHEKKVSEAIRNLYRLAHEEQDFDSYPLLNWFIEEQLEEEATVDEVISQLKLVENDGSGLLRLDADLGGRTSAGTENPEG